MKSLLIARLVLLVLAGVLTSGLASGRSEAMPVVPDAPTVEDLLSQMASEAPDDCSDVALSTTPTGDIVSRERQLFQAVEARVADRLNSTPQASSSAARSRAVSALREVEQLSAKANKSWPAEDRFHFDVLDVPPAILVKMRYRDQAVFVLFGSYYLDKYAATDPGAKWRQVSFADPNAPASGIQLFPLHRGPGGRVRFLAKVVRAGCAGSIGEAYYGYEWNADDGLIPSEFIKIEGAEGLDDAASTHVGRLQTTGKTIQLPYCLFSEVDTWDNPTLCAADSFDLSRDAVVFGRRIYNRPDLVTVAKAIEHAEARDYPAVRGYCASDAVARMLVRRIPPYLFAETVDIVKTGSRREKVALAEGGVRFDLIKHQGRWLIERAKISAESP